MLSNTAVLPGEDPEEFTRLVASAIAEFDPQGDDEMRLVDEYIFHKWRQLRFWSLNTAAIAGELANQTGDAPELLDRDLAYRTYDIMKCGHLNGLAFPLMHRYEVSYANQYHRARRELRKLKAEKASRPKVDPCCSFPNEPNALPHRFSYVEEAPNPEPEPQPEPADSPEPSPAVDESHVGSGLCPAAGFPAGVLGNAEQPLIHCEPQERPASNPTISNPSEPL